MEKSGKKVTETKTHAKKEHRGINSKFASKKHGISSKNMFDHPLSLQGVYSSIFYVNFHSKMKKKAIK